MLSSLLPLFFKHVIVTYVNIITIPIILVIIIIIIIIIIIFVLIIIIVVIASWLTAFVVPTVVLDTSVGVRLIAGCRMFLVCVLFEVHSLCCCQMACSV